MTVTNDEDHNNLVKFIHKPNCTFGVNFSRFHCCGRRAGIGPMLCCSVRTRNKLVHVCELINYVLKKTVGRLTLEPSIAVITLCCGPETSLRTLAYTRRQDPHRQHRNLVVWRRQLLQRRPHTASVDGCEAKRLSVGHSYTFSRSLCSSLPYAPLIVRGAFAFSLAACASSRFTPKLSFS